MKTVVDHSSFLQSQPSVGLRLLVCLVVSVLSVMFAVLSHVELEDVKTKVSAQDVLLQTMQTRISQLEQQCSTSGSVTSNRRGEQETEDDKAAVSCVQDIRVAYSLH